MKLTYSKNEYSSIIVRHNQNVIAYISDGIFDTSLFNTSNLLFLRNLRCKKFSSQIPIMYVITSGIFI